MEPKIGVLPRVVRTDPGGWGSYSILTVCARCGREGIVAGILPPLAQTDLDGAVKDECGFELIHDSPLCRACVDRYWTIFSRFIDGDIG